MAVDSNGTAYISDQGITRVRMMLANSSVTSPFGVIPSQTFGVSLTRYLGKPLLITSGGGLGGQQVWGTWLQTGASFRICGNSWQVSGSGPWSCNTDNSFFRTHGSTAAPIEGGPIYIYDVAGTCIKVIPGIGAPFMGTTSIFAGGGPLVGSQPYTDGVGTNARFSNTVYGMTTTSNGDTLFFLDGGFVRRAVTATATVSTLAGCSFGVAYVPGSGTSACFSPGNSMGLLLTPRWGLLVSDLNNNCIRGIALDGSARVSIVAGQCGTPAGNSLGPVTTALMSGPAGLGVAGDGQSIVIAEMGTNSIKLLSCPSPSPTPSPSPSLSLGFTSSPSPSPSTTPPFAAGCTVLALIGLGACAPFADGSPSEARVGPVNGILTLPNGTVVFADGNYQKIRVISPGKIVTTLAGSGTAGSLDGAATVGQLNNPFSLALEPTTQTLIYVACPFEHKVRTVSLGNGDIGTLAGSGVAGYLNGLGAAAQFNAPYGVTVTPSGTLFVTDTSNFRVRTVSPAGMVAWFSGAGVAGVGDGPPTQATFTNLIGIGWAPWGWLYVADSNRLRSVSPFSGVVVTLAGRQGAGFADGPGVSALFSTLHQLAFDARSGTIFVSDLVNHRIRAVNNASGVTLTIAGSGSGPDGGSIGPALAATLPYPSGLAINASNGALIVGSRTGTTLCFMRVIACPPMPLPTSTPTPTPSPTPGLSSSPSTSPRPSPTAPTGLCYASAFAGAYGTSGNLEGTGPNFGTPPVPLFNSPQGIALLPNSSGLDLAVVDSYNRRIRALSFGGTTSSLLGSGALVDTDGVGTNSAFYTPQALAFSALGGGTLYVAGQYRVRAVALPSLTVTTLAGGVGVGFGDATGTNALFNAMAGLCVDGGGVVYVGDLGNNRVRKITPTGLVSTLAGSGSLSFANGVGAAAAFAYPSGLACTTNGLVYVADKSNHRIRAVVTATGAASVLAGNGTSAWADGVPTSAAFSSPSGLAIDYSSGGERLFISDSGNHRVRMLWGGVVSTLAGTGVAGSIGGGYGGGWGTTVPLNSPTHLVYSPTQGTLYITQSSSHQVVRLSCTWPSGSGVSATASASPPPPSPSPYTPPTTAPASSCGLTTVAGNAAFATPGFANSPATPTLFNTPFALATLGGDGGGGGGGGNTLFVIADRSNNRMRGVWGGNGTVMTLAGSGAASDIDGIGTSASINAPTAVAAPAAPPPASATSPPLAIVAGGVSGRVRVLSQSGALSTLGVGPPGAEGVAFASLTNSSTTGVFNGTAVYIADTIGHQIALLFPNNGTLLPGGLCGVGGAVGGFVDGPCALAAFNSPRGLALGGWGSSSPASSFNRLYIADGNNNRVRSLNLLTLTVSTLAGGAGGGFPALFDGPALAGAAFNSPTALALSPDGARLLVGEIGSHAIRQISLADGAVTTLAYGGAIPGLVNGPALSVARLNTPRGIAFGFNGSSSSPTTPMPFILEAGSHVLRALGGCAVASPSLSLTPSPSPGSSLSSSGSRTSSPSPSPSAPPTPCTGVSPASCSSTRYAGIPGVNSLGCNFCPATTSAYNAPTAIAVDASGTTWMADAFHRVVLISAGGQQAGAVGCWVNTACFGFVDGVGGNARFNTPRGLFADTVSGNVYIADSLNHAIRGFATATALTTPTFTLAGNGTMGAMDGTARGALPPARNATFNTPSAVAVNASGACFVADTGNNLVRIVAGGFVRTLAGSLTGVAGWVDAVGTAAVFSAPRGLALGPSTGGGPRMLYISDSGTHRLRALNLDTLAVTTIGGMGWGGWLDGLGTSAALNSPSHLALDTSSTPPLGLFIADSGNSRIRYLSFGSGLITSVAGGASSGYADGAIPILNSPSGVAVSPTTGGVSFCEANHVARRLLCASASPTPTPSPSLSPGATPSGTPSTSLSATPTPSRSPTGTPTPTPTPSAQPCTVVTLGGTGAAGAVDGPASTSTFNSPAAVAWDLTGTLAYIADSTNNMVRVLSTATRAVSTLAGTGAAGWADSATATTGILNGPTAIVVTGTGMLLVAEGGGNRIRWVIPGGALGTLAGNNNGGYLEGLGSVASFQRPTGLALLPDGMLAVADSFNSRVRLVSPVGQTSLLAGGGPFGGIPLDGVGSAASFSSTNLRGVAVDPGGGINPTVYVADGAPVFRVRAINYNSRAVSTLAGCGLSATIEGTGPSACFGFNPSGGLAWGGMGGAVGLLVADTATSRLRALSTGGGTMALAGGGLVQDGLGFSASFNGPQGLSSPNASGVFLVADTANHRIKAVSCTFLRGAGSTPTPTSTPSPSPSTGAPPPTPSVTPSGTPTPSVTPSAAPLGCTVWHSHGQSWGGYTNGNTGAYISANVNPGGGLAFSNAPGPLAYTLYFAQTIHHSIRVLTPTSIYTLAGGPPPGAPPGFVDGIGYAALFNSPYGVATGPAGGVFVADTFNHAIRYVTSTGVTTTLGGTGVAGYANGAGSSAQFNGPLDVAWDPVGNVVYVVDTNNHVLRSIAPDGTVGLVAGTPGVAGSSGGDGLASARFSRPTSLAFSPAGFLYVADAGNGRIQAVVGGGVGGGGATSVTTLAGPSGGGSSGYVDGPAAEARFSTVFGHLSLGPSGLLLFVDIGSNRLRTVSVSNGAVGTLLGTGAYSSSSGPEPAVGSVVNGISGIALNAATGLIALSEIGAARVKLISCPASASPTPTPTPSPSLSPGSSGTPTPFPTPTPTPTTSPGLCYLGTFAGRGGVSGTTDSPALTLFNAPSALAPGQAPGVLYVADSGNHRVRMLVTTRNSNTSSSSTLSSSTTVSSTLAGNGAGGWADGFGTASQLSSPTGVALSRDGSQLYVADSGSHRLRVLTLATGRVETLAGSGIGTWVDGVGTTASLFNPFSLAVHPLSGDVYVSEGTTSGNYNHRVRTCTPGGVVGTLAGSGAWGWSNGVAMAATFFAPRGLAFDAAGTFLLVADSLSNLIRRIDMRTATVTTLAGSGGNQGLVDSAAAGLGGLARFNTPLDIKLEASSGVFFVAEGGTNARLRVVTALGAVTTVAGGGTVNMDGLALGGGGFSTPRGLAFDALSGGGGLIVADSGAHTLRVYTCPGATLSPSPTPSPTLSAGASSSPSPSPSFLPSSPTLPYTGCTLTTIAGVGAPVPTYNTGAIIDGPPGVSLFMGPNAVNGVVMPALGVAPDTGVAFVVDPARTIRRVPPNGRNTTAFAGQMSCGSVDGLGTNAQLCNLGFGCMDPFSNFWTIDLQTNTGNIRRISTATGIVSSYVSRPGALFFSDGPPGIWKTSTSAQYACATDAQALFLYFGDGCMLRSLNTVTGEVSTVVGIPGVTCTTSDGTLTTARFTFIGGLAYGSGGALFVADALRVRSVTLGVGGGGGGSVTTLAGWNTAGWLDAVGTAAQFNTLRGLALDTVSNVLLVSDFNNNLLRALHLGTLAVTTVAGTGALGYGDGVQGVGTLGRPMGVALGGGFTYVLDAYTVRRLDCPPGASPTPTPTPSPSPSTGAPLASPTPSPFPPTPAPSSKPCALSGCTLAPLIGSASSGYMDGQGGTGVQMSFPVWGAVQPGTNNLWWGDCTNMVIRETTPTGVTRTVAGRGPTAPGFVDSPYPLQGRVMVGNSCGAGCCNSAGAQGFAFGFAFDALSGDLIFAQQGSLLRRLGVSGGGGGGLTTLSGGAGSMTWDGDGLAISHSFNLIAGIAPGATTSTVLVYVCDSANHRVRYVTRGSINTAQMVTLAGSGSALSVDGVGVTAGFNFPRGCTISDSFAADGLLYLADGGFNAGNRVRSVSSVSGVVRTIAGTGAAGSEDSPLGLSATLFSVEALAPDGFGGLVFAEWAPSSRIRRITSLGGSAAVSTLIGGGNAWGGAVAFGPATSAMLLNPVGVLPVVGGNRNVSGLGGWGGYLVDRFAHRINWLSCPLVGPVTTPSPTPTPTTSPSQSSTVTGTPSATGSGTGSGSPTSTFTPTGTLSSTTSPTLSATPTESGTPSPTATTSATDSSTTTESPTPTFTPTPSISLSSSITPSETSTGTSSVTLGASSSATPSPTLTPTSSPSQTPSGSDTTSPTPSPSLAAESPSPTNTPPNTLSPTPSLTSSPSVSSSLSSTITPTASPTLTPPVTPTASPSLSSTPSATATLGSSASGTGSTSPSATTTPSPTPTLLLPSTTSTITPAVASVSPVGVGSGSDSGTTSPTPSSTITLGGSPAPTPSPNPSPSATLSQTSTPTPTISAPPSGTSTISPSPTASLTQGASPSGTGSDSTSGTPTPSSSGTGSGTASSTPSTTLSGSTTISTSPTASLTQGVSPSNTASNSNTGSGTPPLTPSPTPTSTGTQSGSGTASLTPSTTLTASSTVSASQTGSLTQGVSPSNTASKSLSGSVTPPPTPSPSSTVSPTSSGTGTASITATSTVSGSSSITVSPTASISTGLSASNTGSNSLSSSSTGTQTPTPSSTLTPTSSATGTASITPSTTLSASSTLSSSPTSSLTRGASPSVSGSPSTSASLSSTGTPTSSSSGTPSSTGTGTAAVTPTSTVSGSSTVSSSQTPSLTRGASPSNTPSMSSSPSNSGSGSVSALSTPTPTSSATSTPTPTTTSTLTSSSTVSVSPTPSLTRGASPSNTPSSSQSPSVSATQSSSSTGTVTPTSSGTGTASATVSASPTASLSRGASSSFSPTASSTLSASTTPSLSSTSSNTPSGTGTPTSSLSSGSSGSPTGTNSLTSSPTQTPTASVTNGASGSTSSTNSLTASPTPTPTASISQGLSSSTSSTSTLTASPSQTPTSSLTQGASSSSTSTSSLSASPTSSPTPSLTRGVSASTSSTATLSASPTSTPTSSLTQGVSSSSTSTSTLSASPTQTPTPSLSMGVSPSTTSTTTLSASPSSSPTPSLTLGVSPSSTSTSTLSSSPSQTPTPSLTIGASSSTSSTSSLTSSPTSTPTSSLSLGLSPSSSSTSTLSGSPTSSPTPSLTTGVSPSSTSTSSLTASPTTTPTSSLSVGLSPSSTSTSTLSGSPTSSPTPSLALGASPSSTSTSSLTGSPTQTPTGSLSRGSSSSTTSSSTLTGSPTTTPTPSLSVGSSPSTSSTATLTASPSASPTPTLSQGATPSTTSSSNPLQATLLAPLSPSPTPSSLSTGASPSSGSGTPTLSTGASPSSTGTPVGSTQQGGVTPSPSPSPTPTDLQGGSLSTTTSALSASASGGIFSSALGANSFWGTAGGSAALGLAGVGVYQYISMVRRRKRGSAGHTIRSSAARSSSSSINKGPLKSTTTNAPVGGGGKTKRGGEFSVNNPLQKSRR